jgi:hypothetical protein
VALTLFACAVIAHHTNTKKDTTYTDTLEFGHSHTHAMHRYSDEGAHSRLVTLNSLLADLSNSGSGAERAVTEGGGGVGRGEGGEGLGCVGGAKWYLAQHSLFDQIPQLRQDVCVPTVCTCATRVPPWADALGGGEGGFVQERRDMGEGEEGGDRSEIREGQEIREGAEGARGGEGRKGRGGEWGGEGGGGKGGGGRGRVEKVNVWLGPSGTVSPLHIDPLDNVLCQVLNLNY